MRRVLLIDSDNLAHRAFYATYRGEGAPLMAHAGFPTNAIATWSSMLATLIAQADPSRVVFGLEGGSAFRRAFYPDYKRNRNEKPKALLQQLPVIESIIRGSGAEYLYVPNEECDDVLMSFAESARGLSDIEILVASEDKDFSQIVGDNIYQLKPGKAGQWSRQDSISIKESYDVGPSEFALYLALVGDTADNIPGIDGIGPGTASKFLNDAPTLETLAQRVSTKKKWPIEKATEQIEWNLRLTTFHAVDEVEPQRGADVGSVISKLSDLNCAHAVKVWKRMDERFGRERAESIATAQSPLAPSLPVPKRQNAVQGTLCL